MAASLPSNENPASAVPPAPASSAWPSPLVTEPASETGTFATQPEALPPALLPEPIASPKHSKPSGWLVGVVLGVLVGLWLLPPVRYTLGSQLRFALAQDGLPWALTLDSERSLREAPRLDATAALLPDDYLLQVGRATAFVEIGGVRPAASPDIAHADDAPAASDNTLVRLTRVAREFPIAPGAQAHLSRYLMADRVRIQRAELAAVRGQEEEKTKEGKREKGKGISGEDRRQKTEDNAERGMMSDEQNAVHSSLSTQHSALPSSLIPHPSSLSVPATIPARYTDVKLMRLALTNGERLDPNNVFWPAMLAATYFAAGRDTQALAALARCDQKTRWDSYIYEEILGQWRLYSSAYGDHGATQKIGPLSVIAFPHLRELRKMAEMARWHADQEAARGNIREAIQIRHHVLRLGTLLRDTATWAYEALYGTDLTLIAGSDKDVALRETTVRTVRQWQEQAQGYLAFLKANRKNAEIALLTAEVEESCKLRTQVEEARADSSYPGIPPGIPLAALFGAWMTGVCLVQQLLLLALSVAVACLLQKSLERRTQLPGIARLLGYFMLAAVTLISGSFLMTAFLSSRVAIVFLMGGGCLFALLANTLQRKWWRRQKLRSLRNNPHEPSSHAPSDSSLPLNPHTTPGSKGVAGFEQEARNPNTASFAWQQKCVEQKWSRGTTWRMLLGLLTPCLVTLWLLRSLLSSLHPVAQLLSSLMGMEPPVSHIRVFQVALLSCAIPLVFLVGLSVWALWRHVPVLAAVVLGLRRIFLPALACIALVYLLLLHQTLSLDTESTHAINEVARDDMHWVLTHSEGR